MNKVFPSAFFVRTIPQIRDIFRKYVGGWEPLTIFAKSSVLDVWQGSGYAFAARKPHALVITFQQWEGHLLSALWCQNIRSFLDKMLKKNPLKNGVSAFIWAHFREISLWDFETIKGVCLLNRMLAYAESSPSLINGENTLFGLLRDLSHNFCKSPPLKNLRQLERYLFHGCISFKDV